jgi:hypothetical protein
VFVPEGGNAKESVVFHRKRGRKQSLRQSRSGLWKSAPEGHGGVGLEAGWSRMGVCGGWGREAWRGAGAQRAGCRKRALDKRVCESC